MKENVSYTMTLHNNYILVYELTNIFNILLNFHYFSVTESSQRMQFVSTKMFEQRMRTNNGKRRGKLILLNMESIWDTQKRNKKNSNRRQSQT